MPTKVNRFVPGSIMLLCEIHCFVYADQCPSLNNSPASREWQDFLLDENLIKYEDRVAPQHPEKPIRTPCPYRSTKRGRFMIGKWRNTPLPVLEERWT